MEWSCGVLGRVRDPVHPRLCRTLAALLICSALANGATMGTSSWLHVNLSFMPFGYYDAWRNPKTQHMAASYGFAETLNGVQYSRAPSQTRRVRRY
jgi:hypothetical protein